MDIGNALHLLGSALEVFLLDLLLSGDNAVVIALACRRLAPQQRREVLVAGSAIAAVLRVLLALLASLLLRLPLLKLVGGVALAIVAVRLLLDDDDAAAAGGGAHDAAAALRTVVIADVVMSLDNVMALSAVSQGSAGVLALGVAFSVPLLMFGSWLVARLIANYPLIEPLGAALLGWIAGSLAVSDPLYAGWVEAQSPLLPAVVPALVAAYVLLQARIVRERRPLAAALRPAPRQRVQVQPVAVAVPLAAAVAVPMPAAAPRVPAIAVPVPAPLAPARKPARFAAAPWLAAGAALVALGVLLTFLQGGSGSSAVPLRSYDCGGVLVSYLPGGAVIRLAQGPAVLEGAVNAGNQITWKAPAPGAPQPAIAPPRFVRFADAGALGLGGSGADLACKAR